VTRRNAVSAGAAVALAGAAVAVLQVLQQTVGAFHPRPSISVLIVLASFFAGLAAARIRNRRAVRGAHDARAARLGELLGQWPPPRVRDADPVHLGVFPARRGAGAEPAYVPRDVDGDLRAALVPGALVLVFGDPRAGASRTLLEAARQALGDVPLLAPRSPEALRELLSLDPSLRLGDRHVVVWLDGLDRFAAVLDRGCLDAFDRFADRVTVAATIRRADWDAWLVAGGAAGRAARALVERARAFELPAELGERERAAARRMYPDADLTAGIGAAVASTGRDREPPGPGPDPAPGPALEPDPVPAARGDAQLVLPAVAATAALAALVAVWALSGFSIPSISDQLVAIQRAGSRGGRRAVVLATADLHGSGAKSHVLLFEDGPGARRPRSDEIRIYDEHGDRLVRALRFAPTGARAVFQYRATTDVDFDGADEVVGGYGDPAKARAALVPFAIDWDTAAGRYRLVALDLGPPALSRPQHSLAESQYRDVYDAAKTFTDATDHLSLTGHRVQDFIVSPPPHRLVAGWFLRPWIGSAAARFELHTAIFDATRGVPHVSGCTLTGGVAPLVVRAGRDRSALSVFADAYAEASRGRFCRPDALG
jgi:hypothetical protein